MTTQVSTLQTSLVVDQIPASDAIHPEWLEAQRWLLRAGALALPLVVAWDAFDRFILPKLLAARLFGIALLVLWLARNVVIGRWTWRRTALDVPLLAFVGSTGLSSFLAVNHNIALFGTYVRDEGLLTILTYAGIFWLAVQLMPTREEARDLGRVMLLGACVVTVIAVYLSTMRFGASPDTVVGPYVRAFGTMGNPVELGTYLAMLLPLALSQVLDAPSLDRRLLPAAAVIILTTGCIFTFTRAAWAGAIVGLLVLAIVSRPPRRVWIGWFIVLAGAVGLLALGIATGRVGSSSFGQALGSRVTSTATLSQGSIAARVQVWSDSWQLIARRPLFGSGPDTFGLVYPSVETGGAPGIDKAHNDLLQVAVTNGLAGVLAYYLTVATILVQLWRSRRTRWVAAMLAGLIAYYVALQAEFSWIPAALPFWLFAGIAFSSAGTRAEISLGSAKLALWPRFALVGGVMAAGLLVAYLAFVPDLYADRLFARAIHDSGLGYKDAARQEVAWARELNPHESIYATEAGNLAIDMQFGFKPGPYADLVAARNAYQHAVDLGTTDPEAYRGLAVADDALGDHRDAIAAAKRALQLDRLDIGNVALLRMLESR